MNKPVIYLIPTPLGATSAISPDVQAVVSVLTNYVGETAKNTRAFLKQYQLPCPIQEIQITELNEHTPKNQIKPLLKPLYEGQSIGLVSDAGCPGIADPGAALILLAHQADFKVKPIVGPCSITLALMSSGLDSQQHIFLGYLPNHKSELISTIKQIEKESRQKQATIIFIETPYRNDKMIDALLKACQPGTLLSVATDLTLPTEEITTKPIDQWRKEKTLSRNKRPSVFLLRASH